MMKLPEWLRFTEETKPSHGEYMVLLKQTTKYPYIAVAHYTYRNGGQWMVVDKIITKQVEAYMSPRILHEWMVDQDKPSEAK